MKRRVKTKVAQKTMKDPELIDMFNKMTGTSTPDPEIVAPKYDELVKKINGLLKLLSLFPKSPCRRIFKKYQKGFREIEEFIKTSQMALEEFILPSQIVETSKQEIEEAKNDPQKMMELLTKETGIKYNVETLLETYKKLKESELVKSFLIIARNLHRYAKYIGDKNNLSETFMTKQDGFDYKLFDFSCLDFKVLYISDLADNNIKNYILSWLHLVYKNSYEIYKLITSPDIDVERFSELIVNNISAVRKQIPRCDKAFDKIVESVGLLKNNFDGYYKDFIQSQNPGIIIENFVMDVAKNAKTDRIITRQFQKIIQFYRKRAQGHIQNPRIKKIFSMVEQNFSILEKNTGGPVHNDNIENEKQEKNEKTINTQENEKNEENEEEKQERDEENEKTIHE